MGQEVEVSYLSQNPYQVSKSSRRTSYRALFSLKSHEMRSSTADGFVRAALRQVSNPMRKSPPFAGWSESETYMSVLLSLSLSALDDLAKLPLPLTPTDRVERAPCSATPALFIKLKASVLTPSLRLVHHDLHFLPRTMSLVVDGVRHSPHRQH